LLSLLKKEPAEEISMTGKKNPPTFATRDVEQPAAGSSDSLRRAAGYTPAMLGNTALVQAGEYGEARDSFPLKLEFVLPEQFFSTSRVHETGERLLLAAILEDALMCFQRFLFASSQRHRRLFREAERWIMERRRRPFENERMSPYFSFERVCDVLGLDADGVRDRLELWRERQLASVQLSGMLAARQPRREVSHRGMHVRRSKVRRAQAA
jgi:hypothetical protein